MTVSLYIIPVNDYLICNQLIFTYIMTLKVNQAVGKVNINYIDYILWLANDVKYMYYMYLKDCSTVTVINLEQSNYLVQLFNNYRFELEFIICFNCPNKI